MPAFFQSFFVMLAAATDRELARLVQYLKAENRILRDRLPERITVTAQERQRLLKYGKPTRRRNLGRLPSVKRICDMSCPNI